MFQKVDIKKAATCFSDLIQRSVSGKEIIITQEGHPIAKIVAIHEPQKKKRQFGSAAGLIKIAEDFDQPVEDFKEYM